MPEHTPYEDALRTFDPPLATPPPSGPEIRGRGDRARVRRRAGLGAAVGGVVAAAVIIALAIGPFGQRSSQPPVGHEPSPSPSLSTTEPFDALTQQGFGRLRLGMTAEQVEATGEATVTRGTGCSTLHLTDPDLDPAPGSETTDGYISPTYGLVVIYARPGMATQEGIGPGSTVQDLRRAFPDLVLDQIGQGKGAGFYRVDLGDGREYEFGLDPDKTVEYASVRLITQDCFS